MGVEEMALQLNNRTPVYQQVIQYFKEEIVSGRLQQGQEIPSRRELANQLKINPNTVQRAYKEMEEMSLIYTDGNMPSQVTTNQKVIQATREELVSNALNEFIRSVQSIPVPLDELMTLIEKAYEEKNVEEEGDR